MSNLELLDALNEQKERINLLEVQQKLANKNHETQVQAQAKRIHELEYRLSTLTHTLQNVFRDCAWVGFPRKLNIGDTNLPIDPDRRSERSGWMFTRNISPSEFGPGPSSKP